MNTRRPSTRTLQRLTLRGIVIVPQAKNARPDYATITEQPGALLNDAQMQRYTHRYGHAATLAHGRRVLEIACGAGGGLDYLARHARQVIGLDYTAAVLAQAQAATRRPLVQADAQRLPFAADSFDLVVCFEAIYYLADQAALLHESRRVLAPGGVLLLCQSNPNWPDFVPGNLTTHYPSAPELARLLADAGFHDIQLHGILPLAQDRTGGTLRRRLRRALLHSSLAHRLGPLADLVKRIGYGQMTPLPARVDDSHIAAWASRVKLTPLPLDQPDTIHRVIYARATA